MFQNEGSNDQSIAVEMLMSDGRKLLGEITVPYGSQLVKQLNGSNLFIDFKDMDGTPKYIAKSSVLELVEQKAKKAPNLKPSKVMESENPYVVLGVAENAGHEQIRAAYAKLAKTYHPDQFNAVTLPLEVANYMTQMFERVSNAYQRLNRRETAEAAE